MSDAWEDELSQFLNSPEVLVGTNMYTTDIHEWEHLQAAVPTLIISSAGGFVPFQAEGFLHGFPFYMRAEEGQASLSVSPVPGEPPYSADPRNLYSSLVYSDSYSIQDFQMFEPYLMVLIDRLAPPPMRWEFPYVEPVYDKETQKYLPGNEENGVHIGWGETPEEGWLDAKKGWIYTDPVSGYCGAEYWNAGVPSKTPSNVDDRDFSMFDGLDFSVRWDQLPEFTRTLAEETIKAEENYKR